MLGIDEHRYRPVRFFRDPATKTWKHYEPWKTTIVDLDTGQVLGIVDGRDSVGVGDWLFACALQWRLGVQVVAIDPQRRSASPCGCGFRALPFRSTHFTWSSSAMPCSPKSGNVHPAGARPAGALH